ncbi:hypothetical protein Tco_0671375, partial [Tanacetum coccineum]
CASVGGDGEDGCDGVGGGCYGDEDGSGWRRQ